MGIVISLRREVQHMIDKYYGNGPGMPALQMTKI